MGESCCGNCRFFHITERLEPDGGTCHAQPPIPDTKYPKALAIWPVVSRSDWCGQYSRASYQKRAHRDEDGDDDL